MSIRIDGTNTTANPGITGGDADTGLQFGTDEVSIVTGGTEQVKVDSSGNLKFDSGYGSIATAYGCRAWVNFNGTGTVAIRASGNVSSITDNGTGNYTLNFATALPDEDYSPSCAVYDANTNGNRGASGMQIKTNLSASAFPFFIYYGSNTTTLGNVTDPLICCVSIHR